MHLIIHNSFGLFIDISRRCHGDGSTIYMTCNISDVQYIWRAGYLTCNISAVQYIWRAIYLTCNLSDVQYICRAIYLTCRISENGLITKRFPYLDTMQYCKIVLSHLTNNVHTCIFRMYLLWICFEIKCELTTCTYTWHKPV